MKPMRLLLVSSVLSLAAASIPAYGDVLIMDTINTQASDQPTNGMSMDQVTQNFGSPVNVYPAVGDPPITRWEYGPFTVYFEHQTVITTVTHQK